MRALEGQHAVITGAGAGLGQGIALELARHGANVTILEIDPERAEVTAGLIRELGAQALAVPTDVSHPDQVEAAIAAGQEEFGRTDVLVNNAGGVRARAFLDSKESNWRRLIDLNLISALAATSAAVPHMIAGGRGGVVLNVVSIEASRAAPMYSVYAGCKAALVNLTRTWALEFSEHNIRVNALAPDVIITPGIRGNVTGPVDPSTWYVPSPEQQDAMDRYVPLLHQGDVSEFAEVAAFFCLPGARYVTGALIPVDGGTAASAGWIRDPERRGWTLNGLPSAVRE
jgi:NAD(P)-dependent dehydrogenase (short-subunit alcohol dehydrogenase family)